MSGKGVLGNAGPEFKKDIESDEFDNYLVFTYGLDTNLCSWFNASDEVVICGPEDRIEKLSVVDTPTSITTRYFPSHAKLYLMWGEDRIVCWLGSFNFTYSGIYNNVEWAARFSGSLERDLDLTALQAGRFDDQVTESWQILQALELVTSTFKGGDTGDADALLQNTTYPYVLVHSHRSNTLKRALQHELEASDGRVTLTYYSPFVNVQGIYRFVETLEPTVSRENIHLTVRTCRLNNISNEDTGLSSNHVSRLKEELDGFEYHVRAPGSQGNQLRDGRELRSGLAHHKTIGVSYIDEEGHDQRLTLLTTANLTQNAWQHNSGNFEIGLLLRDRERNKELHELLDHQLSHCYERPRDPELDDAVDASSERASYSEVWLEDLLSDRITLAADLLAVKWTDTLPSIDSLVATVYYRDILTGERSPETVTLSRTDDGFEATIQSLEAVTNTIIDFIELDVETSFRPPEYQLTTVGIERLQSGELSLDEIDGETVVCNGIEQPIETIDLTDPIPENLSIRNNYEQPRTVKIVHEPRNHPHLHDTFILDVATSSITDSDLGGFVYLDICVDSAITPRPDQLLFRGSEGRSLDYIGYGYPEDNTIRYYFDAHCSGTEIVVTPAPPLDRYYASENQTVRLSNVTQQTAESVRTFIESELTAKPASDVSGIEIDEETPIAFSADLESVPKDAPVQVQWSIRGYDRFGGSINLEDVLEPQKPHRQIWFRGSIELSTDQGILTLLTRRNSTTVYAQPFKRALKPEKKLLPDTLNLNSLSNHQLLAWLIFDRNELLKRSVQDTEKHLNVTVTEARREYDKVICPVLDEGELLCIPLFGRHRNTTIEFELELELQGGRPEITYYAPRSIQFNIEINATGQSITLDWQDDSHIINHSGTADQVALTGLENHISSRELYGLIQPGDPFKLRDRRNLVIEVREPGLFHLCAQK